MCLLLPPVTVSVPARTPVHSSSDIVKLTVETVIHHRHEFVLYSLRNMESMKVDMHNMGQSTIKLLCATEKTCCSIQKTL